MFPSIEVKHWLMSDRTCFRWFTLSPDRVNVCGLFVSLFFSLSFTYKYISDSPSVTRPVFPYLSRLTLSALQLTSWEAQRERDFFFQPLVVKDDETTLHKVTTSWYCVFANPSSWRRNSTLCVFCTTLWGHREADLWPIGFKMSLLHNLIK